ncbi:MAG: Asp-tRNA(Asn)/Glu-tRNA(Gln) amidotransferase subunit GatB [Alphaproteobacteria bacterium]|nr:Asp-tRNA(Asn)/Glu-tRNA(Gln) amidotransferase subunit GatB [Alphaproteobacteria bacterium]
MTHSFIKTATGLWEVVIGLEVHAQVKSLSKLFSGAATSFAADPNTKVSLVDAALPGMLPVVNKFCIEQAVKTGLALRGDIALHSVFDRKNYFYADLPQGYQISQFYHPIVRNGFLEIDLENGETKTIHIERIHLEQDAGKSIHDLHPDKSFIDLNRSGTALMEIVTKPDMRSAHEAMDFIKKLRLILRYLGSCDANMDEGSLRVDVNISVHRPGTPFGTRAEIKNVNSIRFIGQAIDHEINRQIALLESDQSVDQETRLFDASSGTTRSMRSKEDAQDYRYFPDPDLRPIVLTEDYIQKVQESLPELPNEKRTRFMEDYGLSRYDATVLVSDLETPLYYEKVLKNLKGWKDQIEAAKLASNWISGELFAALNEKNLSIDKSPIAPEKLAQLLNLIGEGKLSGRLAKDVFEIMIETGQEPEKIVDEKGLVQISDTGALEAIVDQVIKDNPKMVEEYKSGKDKLFGFFVGQTMKLSGGKANPQMINEILKRKL